MGKIRNFEDLTIRQLKKILEDYERLETENKLLKIKYPNKRVVGKQEKGANSFPNILGKMGIKTYG